MKIVVPKEIAQNENRVALIPETAAKLASAGMKIVVESGAGERSFFLNREYEKAGAEIAIGSHSLYEDANIIVKVQKPLMNEKLGKHEVDLYPQESLLIAFLQPLTNLDLVKKLIQRGLTSFSMDAVPRITRAQKMDALSSMSTVAGYKAVLLAANASPKFFPMFMTAAGTITPARVFVIGAGVAGLQAIATARRLGAVVEGFDTRPAVKEQVESLGAKFVEVEWNLDEKQAQDAGGYAKELSEEHHNKEMELIKKKVAETDVVITTALIPGKGAPLLITEEMVSGMRPGSVIVDLASEMGGNCALTKADQIVTANGVTIIGYTNLPSMMPYHASQMYSRNMAAILLHLVRDNELNLDWSDEITAGACITHQGGVKHDLTRKLLEEGSVRAQS